MWGDLREVRPWSRQESDPICYSILFNFVLKMKGSHWWILIWEGNDQITLSGHPDYWEHEGSKAGGSAISWKVALCVCGLVGKGMMLELRDGVTRCLEESQNFRARAMPGVPSFNTWGLWSPESGRDFFRLWTWVSWPRKSFYSTLLFSARPHSDMWNPHAFFWVFKLVIHCLVSSLADGIITSVAGLW